MDKFEKEIRDLEDSEYFDDDFDIWGFNFQLSKEFLDSLQTPRGGYTGPVLKLLGIEWPPPKGWKRRTVGKFISTENHEALIQIKKAQAPDTR